MTLSEKSEAARGIRRSIAAGSKKLHEFAVSGAAKLILCFVIFWMVAAASNAGFIAKWGLRDGVTRVDIAKMLDGTAHRPYVYRQLGPLVANFLERHTPAAVKAKCETFALRLSKSYATVPRSSQPKYAFRYLVIYYLSFFSLLVSLFFLRRILIDIGLGENTALVAPVAFVLMLPYLQTKGGYFYDGTELLFLSAGFLLALRGKIAMLVLLTIPATLNKETYVFFLPTLYPLLAHAVSRRDASVGVGIAMSVSLAVGFVIKFLLRDAPGAALEFHLPDTLQSLARLDAYFERELTYGVVGPQGAFIGTLLFLALVAVRGWPRCDDVIKRHIMIAAPINVPLVLLFAFPGELRNLSFLYVGFVVLLGCALDDGRVGATAPGRATDDR
jgi:hypothetical protein